MDIGVCTGVEDAVALASAGAGYLEVNVQQFLKPTREAAAFEESRRRVVACPLPLRAANGFLPGELKSTGPNFNPDGVCDYAAVAFERAAAVGVEHIVFGSGGSRGLPEGFDPDQASDQFVELLGRLGPIAGRFGVTVVVEPLARRECNFLNTVAEGAAVVQRVDHPSIRLLADIYHMLQNEEAPDSLSQHGHLIAHTHVAERADRTCPGIAGDDFRAFFRALAEGGYAGRMSIEGRFPHGIETDAPTAVATLRGQFQDAGA